MMLLLFYVLPFLVLTVLVEAEWFGTATLAMIGSVVTYSLMNRISVIPFIKEHYLYCLEGLGVYLVAGVVWSFAKWFLFLMKFRGKFQDKKEGFLREKALPPGSNVPEQHLKQFQTELGFYNVNGYSLNKVPQASESKSKIVAWMAFWPCSMIGFVLNDPVRRLFNAIFAYFKGSYQKMADKLLSAPELKK